MDTEITTLNTEINVRHYNITHPDHSDSVIMNEVNHGESGVASCLPQFEVHKIYKIQIGYSFIILKALRITFGITFSGS